MCTLLLRLLFELRKHSAISGALRERRRAAYLDELLTPRPNLAKIEGNTREHGADVRVSRSAPRISSNLDPV